MTRGQALSALSWLVDAGCDVLVEEHPHDWINAAPRQVPGHPPLPAAREAGTETESRPVGDPAAATAQTVQQPDEDASDFAGRLAAAPDLATLDALLAAEGPFAELRRPILAGASQPAAIALLIDAPTLDDEREQKLLSGAPGRLLEAMLEAIGLTRADAAIIPLCPVRPDPVRGLAAARLRGAGRAAALRRLSLLGISHALVLGEACDILLDQTLPAARGRVHEIATPEGQIRVIPTFAPAFLLAQPAQKARAWADLLLLSGCLPR